MTLDPVQVQMLADLNNKIVEFSKYKTSDQFIVFGMVWLSLLSSAASALFIAIGKGPTVLVSVLAALPALCMTMNRVFSFSQQYELRRAATANLIQLRDEVQYQGLSVSDASKRKVEILKRFEQNSIIPSLSTKIKAPCSIDF
jgi:hypothetical protein